MRQNKICSIKHREFPDYFRIKTKQPKSLSCRFSQLVCVLCARRAAQEMFARSNGRRIFGWYVDCGLSHQSTAARCRIIRCENICVSSVSLTHVVTEPIRPHSSRAGNATGPFEKDYVNICVYYFVFSDFIVFGPMVFRFVM